ncbi:hypothetical protein ISS04_04615 [Candidatus Woesearchaeota archaeon]|nr:hypothetical protein [Candidatus Woesearchaeota archaeon]
MKKLFGYLLAMIGFIGMFLSSAAGQKMVPFTSKFPKLYILVPSLILVGLGIIALIITGKGGGRGGKARQSDKEVPIYKGEGKKRRIVGYKAED